MFPGDIFDFMNQKPSDGVTGAVIEFLLSVAMVVSPPASYLPQYLAIRRAEIPCSPGKLIEEKDGLQVNLKRYNFPEVYVDSSRSSYMEPISLFDDVYSIDRMESGIVEGSVIEEAYIQIAGSIDVDEYKLKAYNSGNSECEINSTDIIYSDSLLIKCRLIKEPSLNGDFDKRIEKASPILDDHINISGEAFSPLISFILILANMMRVLYWFLHRFDYSLLFQSLTLTVMQFLMIEIIVRKRRQTIVLLGRFGLLKSGHGNFRDILIYCTITMGILFICGTLTLIAIFGRKSLISESVVFGITNAIGYASLMIESAVCMPQVIRNWRIPEIACVGLRWELVLCWVVGDSIKTGVIFHRKAPLPFIVSGIIQIIVDIIIIAQILFYRMFGDKNKPDDTSYGPLIFTPVSENEAND